MEMLISWKITFIVIFQCFAQKKPEMITGFVIEKMLEYLFEFSH